MSIKDTLITPLLLSQEQALIPSGWSLVWDDNGWVGAIHATLGQTQSTFPAKSRGLKFLIAHVNKIHATNGSPSARYGPEWSTGVVSLPPLWA